MGKRNKFTINPITMAALIFIVFSSLSLLLGVLIKTVQIGVQTEMVVLVILSLLFIIAVSRMRWWKTIGFQFPITMSSTLNWWIPWAIVLIIPFLSGAKSSSFGHFGYLLVGYLLTGFLEEGMFRGILWKILLPLGEKRTIVITAVFFALSHLGNLLYRNPAIVFAQMLGAFVDGIGLGAIRARSGTIWMVIGLHAMHDLVLQYSNFPLIPLDVVQVTLLMVYGMYILKQSNKTSPQNISTSGSS